MDAVGLVAIAFQVSVALTVFCFGLNAEPRDVLQAFRRPRQLLVSLLAMFVVMPVVALALEIYLDFPHATRVALVVLALTPIPALLARTAISSGGRAEYAYGLGFSVCLLSIVVVPALVDFLGRVMSRPFAVEPGTVATTMLVQVLAPLGLGFLVRQLAPRLSNAVGGPLVKVANVLVAVACVVLLVLVAPALVHVTTWVNVAALAAFTAAGLGVGHLLGGPEPDQSVVLAIACSNRNPGLAIGIASANFPAENFAATIILYAILVGVVTKPYIRWQQGRLQEMQAAQRGGRDGQQRPAVP